MEFDGRMELWVTGGGYNRVSLHSMTDDDMVDGGDRKVPALLDPQVATSSLILAK
jgi:hypothetical protein